MELSIIKRESTGSGPNMYNENETVTKYDIPYFLLVAIRVADKEFPDSKSWMARPFAANAFPFDFS